MQKMIGGILLVAGTTIGAGMLALPIVTGLAGFWLAIGLIVLFWAYMTYTAFLMLEVNLWLPDEKSHLISMVEATLGKPGKVVAWIAYLFLLYALTTAYLAGGGPLLNELLATIFGISFPKFLEPLPLLVLFGYFVYRGTSSVDLINRLLMIGMAITFVLMVSFLLPHVNLKQLFYHNASLLLLGLSVVATSFGYHVILPTLTQYLQRDVRILKKVILYGSLIPLGIYLLWQFLVLGIIPVEGSISLTSGYEKGMNGADLLGDYLGGGSLSEMAKLFSIIAIITSFLGVSMSLSDFLADGFKIPRTAWGNLGILLLTFGPPIGFALTNPRAFILALEYAGAFGVVFLLGLMPALMVWKGRATLGKNAPYKTPGGYFALMLTMGFSLFIIGYEIFKKLGI